MAEPYITTAGFDWDFQRQTNRSMGVFLYSTAIIVRNTTEIPFSIGERFKVFCWQTHLAINDLCNFGGRLPRPLKIRAPDLDRIFAI